MKKFFFGTCVLLLLAGCLFIRRGRPAQDTWLGAWKLNLASSKIPNPPSTETLKLEPVTGGMRLKMDAIYPNRTTPVHIEYTVLYDGAEHPQRPANPDVTMSFKRVDAHSFDLVEKNEKAKRSTVIHVAVSPTSRTLTYAPANGAPIRVYDPQ
jgi:hypothetical protein